jgi:hypothetical protein
MSDSCKASRLSASLAIQAIKLPYSNNNVSQQHVYYPDILTMVLKYSKRMISEFELAGGR